MSRSVVRIVKNWFECNDAFLAVWASLACERILTQSLISDWLFDFADRADRFARAGTMFTVFHQQDFVNPDRVKDFIELNAEIEERLLRYGEKIPPDEVIRLRIGGVYAPEGLETAGSLKVTRSIFKILTGEEPDGEYFAIQEFEEAELRFLKNYEASS